MMVLGQSGCGKSSWLRKQKIITDAKRVAYFDYKAEYSGGGIVRVRSVSEFYSAMKAAGHGSIKIALVDQSVRPVKTFEDFHRIIFTFASSDAPITVVNEEVGNVTRPNSCGDSFFRNVKAGRSIGIKCVGTAQRPADCDKSLLAEASTVFVGKLKRKKDLQMVSDETGFAIAEFEGMKLYDYRVIENDVIRSGRTEE